MTRFRLLTMFVVSAPIAACTGGGGGGKSAAGYFSELPSWPPPEPESEGPTGGAVESFETGSDQRTYRCESTPYSLTSTPDKIVTFNPLVDVLWPGALIQGGPLLEGTLEALPLTARAALDISIPGLLFDGNTLEVEDPDVASVQAAIGTIIADAVAQEVVPSSSVSYTQTDAYSSTQSALDVGISASYLGVSLDASLGLSEEADYSSVVGYFVQNMFTVTVPQPSRPTDFFEGLSGEDVDAQIAAGHLGPTNLPAYVSSVTYGRIMMFSITSRASRQEIQAALNLQFAFGAGGGGLDASYESLLENGSTSFRVVTVGGDAQDAQEMILSGDPTAFFGSSPPITTGVPISYTLRNLGSNLVAAVSETTDYSVRTCVESTTGPGATFYLSDYGTIRTYDADGADEPLTVPIVFAGQGQGVAWAEIPDRIYVAIHHDVITHSVQAFEADGTPVALTTPINDRGFGLAYDARHDRLYMAMGSTAVVNAYNTDGGFVRNYGPVPGFARDVTYDVDHDRILAISDSAGRIVVFDIGGNDVTPPGGFAGLDSPRAIHYSSEQGQVFVTDVTYTPAVEARLVSFDDEGTFLDSFELLNASSGIAYDGVKDRILVIDEPDSLAQLFEPGGAFSPIANGSFAPLAGPVDAAFRP